MSSKKISQLPAYVGSNNPNGDIPISINGVTYKIKPNKMGVGGALATLSDVFLDAVTNGQVLAWNSTTNKWENLTVGGISTPTLQEVTDVGNETTNEIKAFIYSTGQGTGLVRLIADEAGVLVSYDNILIRNGDFETSAIDTQIQSTSTASRMLNLPDASGTIALTSDITADNADALKRDGSNANAALNLGAFDIAAFAIVTHNESNRISLQASNVTGSRSAEWQDKDYAGIADITDIPDVSGFIPEAPNDTKAYVRGDLGWVIGYTKSTIDTLLGNKVDKVTGKSLIADTEITRVGTMATNANVGVVPNTAITGGTKTKITYDSKGLVTSGADSTTTDIAEGTNLYHTNARSLASVLTGLSASSGTFVATDTFLTAFNKIKYLIDNISTTYQAILTETNFGTFITGLTAKTTIVDADTTNFSDSADSSKAKKVTALNIYTYLKAKFDSIYETKSFRIMNSTAYTDLVGGTGLRTMFGISATVKANTTYEFECNFALSSISATSGTFSFGILGTAGIASIYYNAVSNKSTSIATALSMSFTVTTASILTSSGTATSARATIKGVIRTNATPGTIIPAYAVSISANPVTDVNSFFKITEIGADTFTNG